VAEVEASLVIAEWGEGHPRWEELRRVVEELGQTNWVAASAPYHRSSHLLVALEGGAIAGFLRFVVQPIGPELDRPPVVLDGEVLLEAKVLAFATLPDFRRRGVGRALQEATIERAVALECHQVRSHSGGSNLANHRLKLAMGFGIHPIVRGDDTGGAYFILPLPRRAGG
jgi:GNAT superfamily N-acetyltransferase